LADDARLQGMGDAMRALAKEDAADRIAEEVLELAAARR
jgi:UDP-N-acetylglucosamine:LPS N-acetylglucosamine transferase